MPDLDPAWQVDHPINTSGRDFIVGDLHGCRQAFDRLLEQSGFDAATDRVFSVGDLVDRGIDSMACLDLLDAPWFHAVLGNHDAMLLAYLEDRDDIYASAFVANGGLKWLAQVSARETLAPRWIERLRALPLVRVIGRGTPERFQVLHAERLDCTGQGLTDAVLDDPHSTELARKHYIIGFDELGNWRDHLLWGRELRWLATHTEQLPEVPDLSRTYVGHTITAPRENRLFGILEHVYLDTGGYMADARHGDMGLTLFCHQENRGWLWAFDGPREVRLA